MISRGSAAEDTGPPRSQRSPVRRVPILRATGVILVPTMRIPPLLRTILMLAAGLSAALYGFAESGSNTTTAEWIDRSPLKTRGCPGLARQIERWKEWLEMPPWTIESECGFEYRFFPDHLGLSMSLTTKRKAIIFVREGLSTALQNRVVIHELVHVGIAAGRWSIPAGREEEDFVLEKTESILDGDEWRQGRAAADGAPASTRS